MNLWLTLLYDHNRHSLVDKGVKKYILPGTLYGVTLSDLKELLEHDEYNFDEP